ncbi:hypothetical protein GCM10010357_11710 [Streptomyces luteireticuli]|uniref:Uncharacterized protein n=1 Tax=Streptomyces luteireticuli TaxID=173858 RepID=A0ABP3I7K2_9ACTN
MRHGGIGTGSGAGGSGGGPAKGRASSVPYGRHARPPEEKPTRPHPTRTPRGSNDPCSATAGTGCHAVSDRRNPGRGLPGRVARGAHGGSGGRGAAAVGRNGPRSARGGRRRKSGENITGPRPRRPTPC